MSNPLKKCSICKGTGRLKNNRDCLCVKLTIKNEKLKEEVVNTFKLTIKKLKEEVDKNPNKIKKDFLKFLKEIDKVIIFENNQPCKHSGCVNHLSHSCEVCGRYGSKGRVVLNYLEYKRLLKLHNKDIGKK